MRWAHHSFGESYRVCVSNCELATSTMRPGPELGCGVTQVKRNNMLSAVTEHYVGNWSSVPVAEVMEQLTYVLPSTITKLY